MRGKRTNRTRSGRDWAERFLKAIASGDTIKQACAKAGIGRTAVYDRRDADPAFSAALADAIEDSTDELERVAIARGKEKSDPLLMFMLRARRPEYRDKLELSGARGGPIQIADMTDAELARIASEQADASNGGVRASAPPAGSP